MAIQVVAGAAPQAKVANPVQAAIDAFTSGTDPSTAVYGTPDAVKGIGASAVDDEVDGDSEANDGSFQVTDGEETVEETSESTEGESTEDAAQDEQPKQEAKPEDVEYINVTDESGKKRLKIDWNDKETIKKQLSLLAGARKWQAERDVALSKLKEVESKQENIKAWDAVETAWTAKGMEGVADLLLGKTGAFKEWRDEEFKKVQAYQQASPQEREYIDMQERIKAQQAQIEETSKRLTQESERAVKDKAEAQQAEIRSYATDAFMKNRFDGQLGDPVAEQQMNEVIWSQTLARIDAMPDGTQMTPQLFEKEFKAVSDTFRKVVKSQVASGTKKVLDDKKEAAQTKLNSAAKSSAKPATKDSEEFTKNVKSGNITDALKALMSGKIRL